MWRTSVDGAPARNFFLGPPFSFEEYGLTLGEPERSCHKTITLLAAILYK
jgi:hypothetical protein